MNQSLDVECQGLAIPFLGAPPLNSILKKLMVIY